MKTISIILLIVLFSGFSSCKRSSAYPILSVNGADSLVSKWNQAWNSKKADEVMNLMAKDASLVLNKKVIKGRDFISKYFVYLKNEIKTL